MCTVLLQGIFPIQGSNPGLPHCRHILYCLSHQGICIYLNNLDFPGGPVVKNIPAMWETWVWSLGREDPLEEEMATHSSIFGWRIPMDRGAWWATVYGVCKESDMTEWLNNIQFVYVYNVYICTTYIYIEIICICVLYWVTSVVYIYVCVVKLHKNIYI